MAQKHSQAPLFKVRTYFVATMILFTMVFPSYTGEVVRPFLRIRVIFDNVRYDEQLISAWGFSCIIEGLQQVVLFDTGSDGNILLANMGKMGIDPGDVDKVFISHIHGDHTGGLEVFLHQNPRVTVYLPASFPDSFKKSITALGAEVRALNKPEKLFDNVYTTGELGAWIKEQSLVINTPKGLVILTGCAHPGIVQIVSKTKGWLQKEVYLLMGGFHLQGQPLRELQRVGGELKKLGVKKVAPSHCTGDAARKSFRELWGQNFLESGVGAIIELQP
jgi:7,8-dihydropterin-6-yl-methyl-4-(beta-D-ribofuranosyl)aminobenzene 5'-phosphate synthase